MIFAGLCNGAKEINSLSFSLTSSVTRTDFGKYSPPWTTLCPTAPISSRDCIAPYSGLVKISKTLWRATSWSTISSLKTTFSPLAVLWVIIPPEIPILSTSPFPRILWSSILKTWYLRDELPEFTTKIFIATPKKIKKDIDYMYRKHLRKQQKNLIFLLFFIMILNTIIFFSHITSISFFNTDYFLHFLS